MAIQNTTSPFGMNAFNTFGFPMSNGYSNPFGLNQNMSIFNDDFLANATFNTPSFTSNIAKNDIDKNIVNSTENATEQNNENKNTVTLSNTTPTVLGGLGVGAGTYFLSKPNIIKDGKFADYILKVASESETINGVLKADVTTDVGKTALNNEVLRHWDDTAKAFKKDAPEELTKAVRANKLLKAGKYGLIAAGAIWLLNQIIGGTKIST